MKNQIQIKTRPLGDGVLVEGYVGDRQIMSMNTRTDGSWTVGSSSCLPTDPALARLYLECMGNVMGLAENLWVPTQEQQ